MAKFIDLAGQRFGKWTVVSRAENKGTTTMWNCICDCGTTRTVSSGNLRRGVTHSCGCTHFKHGKKHTRLYNIWGGMKARCYRKSHVWYKRYGGRGITICDEWRDDFKAFYDWAMANGYKENLTIDRIDNNGNYCPVNCTWATEVEQKNNRSNNQTTEINGKTQTIAEWATETGLNYQTVYRRYQRGVRGTDLIRKPVTPRSDPAYLKG